MSRWVLVALLAAVGCNKAPSEDDCKALLDRLVDLELKKGGAGAGGGDAKADLAKQKAAIVDAKLTDGFVETCTKKTSRARIDCVLAAADLDNAVARCDEGK